MSIQRWTPLVNSEGRAQAYATPDGPYVAYADHVAAVAEAEQRGYDRALGDEPVESDPLYLRGRNDGYDAAMNEVPAIAVYVERLRSEGHAAGLDAAREAVAAELEQARQSRDWRDDESFRNGLDEALAAIDALKENHD